jgi:signal transduction histidine kinase/ActR/RegA family two-component response regulator
MADLAVSQSLLFLAGGGEMGARLRALDWSRTPIGPPQRWPQPLRTLVSVMLGSEQPMFIAWGPERTVLYNDGYACLCGAKHPSALGRPFSEIWSDIIADVGPIMDRAYAGCPTHMEDVQFMMVERHRHLEETHFAFSYTPVRDETGRVVGTFCVCNETTGRVFTDRRLRFLFELSERFRGMVEPRDIMAEASAAVGAHLGADRAGYVELEDESGQFSVQRDWIGGSLPSISGVASLRDFESLAEILRTGRTVRIDDVEEAAYVGIAQAFAAKGVRAFINVPLIKGGECVAVLFLHQASPRHWRDDEEALARDVAERTWDAASRARSERKLREADARKDEFLAMLAHELRNPLAPLRTGLHVLRATEGDWEAVAKVRDMMDRQLAHMVRLVDDLLDVSRVSRGLVELRKERVDLVDIVASAVETSLPLIEAGGHDLTVSLAPGPLPLDADPTRLAQVLSNLLNNAAKYTPPGGRIVVSAAAEGDEIVVRVRDTGIGIPAHMLPRVFDMFMQVGGATERSQGGLGIGLMLVKRLTEMHGGTVGAESSGHGSVFTVRLPRAGGRGADEPRRGASAASGPAPREEPLRVLVVDDNADSVGMLLMLIELQGHKAMGAQTGVDALSAAASFRPHVVFLDIGLPGLDGYEVARELRQRPDGPRMILAALTGWGSEDDKQRTHQAGFNHHLTKPVDPAVIEQILAEAAERLRRQA